MNLKFIEKKETATQQTLVSILKRYTYYFEPVIEYDNHQFYLIIHDKVDENNNEPSKVKKALSKLKGEYNGPFDCPLKYSINDCGDKSISVPIVFTREEVLNIVKDAPDTYTGKEEL